MNWTELCIAIGMALYFIFPAYTANSFALIVGGGAPMDFGKKLKDNKRILGDGKTWRGFFGGVLLATGVGLLMNYVALLLPIDWVHPWSRTDWAYSTDWRIAFTIIFLLCLGTMIGDALGSFIKRRKGVKQGGKVILLDQLTFIIVSWIFLFIFATNWFLEHYWYDYKWIGLIIILVLTIIIHRIVNWVGYKIGAKNVPW